MESLRVDAENPGGDLVSFVSSALADGRVFIYPTDTVYGIGCSIAREDSVRRVYAIKNRGLDKPLSVAFPDIESVKRYAFLDREAEQYIREHVDEPYTFIVKKRGNIPDIVTAGLDTVGVRIPDLPLLKKVLAESGPILTTSANLSGDPAPARVEDIKKELIDAVDYVLDAGPCRVGRPSTVIDLSSGRILR